MPWSDCGETVREGVQFSDAFIAALIMAVREIRFMLLDSRGKWVSDLTLIGDDLELSWPFDNQKSKRICLLRIHYDPEDSMVRITDREIAGPWWLPGGELKANLVSILEARKQEPGFLSPTNPNTTGGWAWV